MLLDGRRSGVRELGCCSLSQQILINTYVQDLPQKKREACELAAAKAVASEKSVGCRANRVYGTHLSTRRERRDRMIWAPTLMAA